MTEPSLVRYDGLYASQDDLTSGRTAKRYYRFYPDQMVVVYSSVDNPQTAAKWCTREHATTQKGKYTADNASVAFETVNANGGRVSYTGSQKQGKLELNWHSLINNAKGTDTCDFVEVGNLP